MARQPSTARPTALSATPFACGRTRVMAPHQGVGSALEFFRTVRVEELDLVVGSSKVLQSSNGVFCGFAGFGVASEPHRVLVLNDDSDGVITMALMFLADNDVICSD